MKEKISQQDYDRLYAMYIIARDELFCTGNENTNQDDVIITEDAEYEIIQPKQLNNG